MTWHHVVLHPHISRPTPRLQLHILYAWLHFLPHPSAHTIEIRSHVFISTHNSDALIHAKKNPKQISTAGAGQQISGLQTAGDRGTARGCCHLPDTGRTDQGQQPARNRLQFGHRSNEPHPSAGRQDLRGRGPEESRNLVQPARQPSREDLGEEPRDEVGEEESEIPVDPAVEHHRRRCRRRGRGQTIVPLELRRDARVSLRPHRPVRGGGNRGRLTEATASAKLRYSMAVLVLGMERGGRRRRDEDRARERRDRRSAQRGPSFFSGGRIRSPRIYLVGS